MGNPENTKPENNKPEKSRDELFWLFPVLLVVAIIGITILVKPGSFESTEGLAKSAAVAAGQVSGAQAESEVIIPESDGSGVKTLDDLGELLKSFYHAEDGESVEGNVEDTDDSEAAETDVNGEDDEAVVTPEADDSGVRTLESLAELLKDEAYQTRSERNENLSPEEIGDFTESTELSLDLKIVIRSDIEDEGNSDIYLIDETGYNPVRLTDWDSVECFPAITSDGSRVYFISDRDDDPNNPNPYTKNTEIYMIDMDLFGTPSYSGPARITYNNTTDYGISVSADGNRIVYMSATKENPDNPVMMLANGDGGNEKIIADYRLKNCVPKISGNGNYVVYNSWLDDEMDIYLYDIEGKYHVNLTNSDIPEYFPNINYDGSVIIYEKLLGGTPQAEDLIELFICDRDGMNEQQVTMNLFADTFPALTDDGEWVIFVSKRWDFNGDTHFDEALFYMDIQGENVYKIQKDPYYEEQPDV